MKLPVLYSLVFVGVVYHPAHAAQPDYQRSVTSSQTTTVSIVKTETVNFIGQNDILLQQSVAGVSPATGSTEFCFSNLSQSATITLSTIDNKEFKLSEENSGSQLPYTAQLIATSVVGNAACAHGQHYQLNLLIPQQTYNTASPGNYTDTLTITIAAE